MKKSLVKLANEEKKLPDRQLMDEETLQWIAKNKPRTTKIKIPQNSFVSIVQDVRKYTPPDSWFYKKDSVDTIHGLRHIMRVIANASLLSQRTKSPTRTRKNILTAAALHDLRRKNDKGDRGHALRAKNWFQNNRSDVEDYYEILLEEKDCKEISANILLHEVPYASLSSKDIYKLFKDPVDLLKSADALDRYRLPKLKWWLNQKYLKLKPNSVERWFAYNLVLGSEKNYLNSKDSKNSVLSALEEMEVNYETK